MGAAASARGRTQRAVHLHGGHLSFLLPQLGGAGSIPTPVSALWMRSRGADGDGLVATLYGPCRVATKINGVAVGIVEKTGYPFSFDIEFSIEAAAEVAFPLRLRVPAWSGEPVVTAAGAAVTRDQRGFLVVSKKWKTGDTVRLALKPAIRGRTAVNGTTAVAYGPLVFSLPIPEKAQIIKRFPEAEAAGLKDFYAYQYDPAGPGFRETTAEAPRRQA